MTKLRDVPSEKHEKVKNPSFEPRTPPEGPGELPGGFRGLPGAAREAPGSSRTISVRAPARANHWENPHTFAFWRHTFFPAIYTHSRFLKGRLVYFLAKSPSLPPAGGSGSPRELKMARHLIFAF